MMNRCRRNMSRAAASILDQRLRPKVCTTSSSSSHAASSGFAPAELISRFDTYDYDELDNKSLTVT